MSKVKLMQGDNIESLKKLPDNCIDSVVTDPPYGLSFMNKKWDYDVPSVEFWKEVYRVLKPGGHILSFGGTRTYHRMVVNMEDAGFEIRDQIMWIYGSGFPKSHNISKKIEQEIDNLIYNYIWKNKLDNVKIVEPTLKRNQIEVGKHTEIQSSVQVIAVEKIKEKQNYQNVIVVEKNSTEVYHILKENPIVQESVGQFIIQQQDLVKCVEQLKEDQIVKLLNIFIAEESVKDMLKEHSMNKIKVEEVQKTLNGSEKFYVLEIIPVLCVVLPKILKHIILNQSKIFQSLDTKSQMDYVSVTNVIITKSIMEHLIGNTVNILKRRINFTIDTGHTALKPANEPICLARKPLSEKTIADNVLRWGTGGINIDVCRIESNEELGRNNKTNPFDKNVDNGGIWNRGSENVKPIDTRGMVEGRFPANIIFDEEAGKLLDEQSGYLKSGEVKPHHKKNKTANGYQGSCYGKFQNNDTTLKGYGDGGGASRFFYVAKVSKKERNMGLDGFEEKVIEGRDPGQDERNVAYKTRTSPRANTHPTVKPINLMTYLCRLITPENGIVLDPFMGSGSTGIAAQLEGFRFCGMEMDENYFKIAEARINNFEKYRKFLK